MRQDDDEGPGASPRQRRGHQRARRPPDSAERVPAWPRSRLANTSEKPSCVSN
jgi:hypothetical protein